MVARIQKRLRMHWLLVEGPRDCKVDKERDTKG